MTHKANRRWHDTNDIQNCNKPRSSTHTHKKKKNQQQQQTLSLLSSSLVLLSTPPPFLTLFFSRSVSPTAAKMVLGDLGRKIKGALWNMTSATVIDEEVFNDLVKDICRALLESDVQVGLVSKLRDNIK